MPQDTAPGSKTSGDKANDPVHWLRALLPSRLQALSALGLFQLLAGQLFRPAVARLVFAILFLGFAVIAFMRPAYDWDALAYMALVVEHNFNSPDALHQFIYETVKVTLGPAGWQQLAHMDAWRESQFASADNFQSMLGFYRVKLGYVALVALASKIVGVAYAPWVVGSFFGLATFALFYALLVRLDLERFFLLTIPVLLAADLAWLMRLPTPDSMSCFFMLLGVYLFTADKRAWAYLAWTVAVLTRPDNLVFMPAIAIVQVLRRDMKLWEWFGLLLPVAGYIIATHNSGHPGWWPHFYFTNVAYLQTMNDFSEPFSLQLYFYALLNGAAQMIYKAGWFHAYLALLLIYALAQLLKPDAANSDAGETGGPGEGQRPWPGIWDGLIAASLLAVVARLIVFPFMSGRLLCPMVLIALLATLVTLRDMVPEPPDRRLPDA